jgi:hypothetical protein
MVRSFYECFPAQVNLCKLLPIEELRNALLAMAAGVTNLFWPITWDAALIQTWELTLRSPRLWRRGQFHLAYANQFAQATAPITGGLICPPDANMLELSAARIWPRRPQSEEHVCTPRCGQ